MAEFVHAKLGVSYGKMRESDRIGRYLLCGGAELPRAAVVAWLAGPWFAAPAWILALFCLNFFRDPEREIPAGPVAVSPADGKVVAVKAEGPALNRISIFLNIFDVHVNRAPIAGAIRQVQYQRRQVSRGQPRRMLRGNEQNVVTVEGDGSDSGLQTDRRTDRAAHRLPHESRR